VNLAEGIRREIVANTTMFQAAAGKACRRKGAIAEISEDSRKMIEAEVMSNKPL
jgi:hypothetical protein